MLGIVTMRTQQRALDYPWIADHGDGTFANPILCADYPDPDVIRDGADFFMVVSSFHCTPGLPILHSRDLVNWTIVNHAVENLPHPRFESVQPGCGVWAPSIRKHLGRFWIFFSMPDEGIYCTTADHPTAAWSAPHLLQEGKGLIDPCPLWDDDGNAYLVHAYAESRAGLKHKLRIRPMAPDGSRLLGNGRVVFDDPRNHPTVEGPKFLKRNGYYFILAPAGGVENGWQLALRSRHIFGPYEEKIILEQGATSINGPHQGALVDTPAGQWWFFHFQDAKPYGRVLHLQPARWEDDWPLVGIDQDGNGVGEPVASHPNPIIVDEVRSEPTRGDDALDQIAPQAMLQTSDDFDQRPLAGSLGPQWHWNANHHRNWFSLTARPGWLRLFAQPAARTAATTPGEPLDLIHVPSVLLQKFPARAFAAQSRLDFHPPTANYAAGLAVLGKQYAALILRAADDHVQASEPMQLACVVNGRVEAVATVPAAPLILAIHVADGGACSFSYQVQGDAPRTLPVQFQAVEGVWVGAKIGIFAIQLPHGPAINGQPIEPVHADFDYLRFDRAGPDCGE
jgi:beta-xylosidase